MEGKRMADGFVSPGGGGPNQGGSLQLPNGINLQLPNINIGGGGGGNPGNQGNTNQPGAGGRNPNDLLWMLPFLALMGGAGFFPSEYEKSGTTDSTTDTSGKTTLDTLLNYNQQQTGTSVTGVTPTLSPETQQLMDKLIGRYSSMSAPSLTGYGAQQTANINAASGVQQQAVNNILAARGLSTSPVAATAQTGLEQNRLNQITSMQQGLPILKNQMDLQNLAGASAFFGAIPKGSLTTSITGQQTSGQQTGSQTGTSQQTSTTKGTTTEKGSQKGGLSGLLAGLGGAYAYLLPYILSGRTPPPTVTGLPKQPGTPGAEGGSLVNPNTGLPFAPGDEGYVPNTNQGRPPMRTY